MARLVASLGLCCFATILFAREPVVGGCDGCEIAFEGMPAKLEVHARIAPPQEKGEPLLIEGVVRTASGEPAAGVILYAHHTDASGIYPRAAVRHGRLRGWVVTDGEGRYSLRTIRPAAYPGRSIPQHVHLQVIERGHATYYIDEIEFDDDPLLTAALRRSREGRGGSGIVTPRRDADGSWRVQRDVVLGRNVPGYTAP